MSSAVEPTISKRPSSPPSDDVRLHDHRTRLRRRTVLWTAGLTVLLVTSLPVAACLGPVPIAPGTVARIAGHHLLGLPAETDWTAAQDSIVWRVRLPRVLLGAIVGAALATSGAALQAMVRNVLADPYLLGISSGASTGVALTLLFGVGAGIGVGALTASAFVGALLAMAAVFLLARSAGRITSLRLLLSGVAIGYVLAATTSFLVFASHRQDAARAVLFWLLGSLSQARWSAVVLAGCVVLAALATMIAWGRRLDALSLGDDVARTLGVPPTTFRVQCLVLTSLCVGAAVAVAGGIGFVGLVVPHVARLCVGGVHRRMLPVAALIGAVFLVWADVIARLAFDPRELPLGILTAVAGAPLLFILVRRYAAAEI